MEAVIETNQLARRFGKAEAVRGLTFAVEEGSIYALLGPNGAGKTTTIKMLLNLLAPTSGEARILGTDSTRLGPAELSRIGYVSENQVLPEDFTIAGLLAYCRPFYPTWDDAFATRLLAQFGLPLDRKLKHLSRGMKMKAALLSSLAYRPRLLVLDEPFSGLDPLVRDEFIRGVLELSEQEKWTVLLSSHDIDEVERLADQVGILNGGELHLSESTEALQARFRAIEFAALAGEGVPSGLPESWLNPERAGHTVRFVESRFQGEEHAASQINAFFPGASAPTIAPLPLREIFLSLARTFRLHA